MQFNPLNFTAPDESAGESWGDRLTSPLFLAGIGMLTGGMTGEGIQGMNAGMAAGTAMQRTALAREKMRREAESRAAIQQVLGYGTPSANAAMNAPQSAGAAPGAPIGGAPTGTPQAGATPGTGAPVDAQRARLMQQYQGLMRIGTPRAFQAARAVMAHYNALEADKVGGVYGAAMASKYGSNWTANPEAIAEYQALKQADAAAGAARVYGGDTHLSSTQLRERPDGSTFAVREVNGKLVTEEVSPPTGKDKISQDAFAALRTTRSTASLARDVLRDVQQRGSRTVFSEGGGSLNSTYGQLLLKLKDFYELGVMSAQDERLITNIIGTNPTSLGTNIQDWLAAGARSRANEEQLASLVTRMESKDAELQQQLDSSYPNWRNTWGAGFGAPAGGDTQVPAGSGTGWQPAPGAVIRTKPRER